MTLPAVLILLLQAAASAVATRHGSPEVFEPHVLYTFDWRDPFPEDGEPPHGFNIACQNERTFYAKQYTVGELRKTEWASALSEFQSWHDYGGSWDGWDRGGDDRDIILMEWKDVPDAARHQVEAMHHQRHHDGTQPWYEFGLFEKPNGTEAAKFHDVRAKVTAVMMGWDHPEVADEEKVLMFAPGSLYGILPLFVAKGSSCEDEFGDLGRYKHYAEDEGVIAWVTEHSKPNNHDISIKIKAYLNRETEHTKSVREMWHKVYRQAQRQNRKYEREERRSKRQDLYKEEEEPERHVRDEL